MRRYAAERAGNRGRAAQSPRACRTGLEASVVQRGSRRPCPHDREVGLIRRGATLGRVAECVEVVTRVRRQTALLIRVCGEEPRNLPGRTQLSRSSPVQTRRARGHAAPAECRGGLPRHLRDGRASGIYPHFIQKPRLSGIARAAGRSRHQPEPVGTRVRDAKRHCKLGPAVAHALRQRLAEAGPRVDLPAVLRHLQAGCLDTPAGE